MTSVHKQWICLLFCVLIFAASSPDAAGQAIDFTGYAKSYLQFINPAEIRLNGGTLGQSGRTALTNRLRLRLRTKPHDDLLLTVAYDFEPRVYFDGKRKYYQSFGGERIATDIYRTTDIDRQLWLSSGKHYGLSHNLDRLLLAWSLPRVDIYVGRQAIAWGAARAVNPTDILAPFAYGELDTEDRQGVDAVRMRVPIVNMGEIDAGMAFGEGFEWDNSAWFVRGRQFIQRTDITGTVAGFRGNFLLGLDLTRALGGAGSWLEAAYVIVDEDSPPPADNYWRLTAGADYSLSDGTYLFAEYHYNGPGTGNPAEYPFLGYTIPYQEGAVYLLGTHYLIPGITHPLTPLTILTMESLINLDFDDPSAYLLMQLEYNVAVSWYVSGGIYKALGKSPYQSLGQSVSGPIPASEFGSYPDLFFLSARMYF